MPPTVKLHSIPAVPRPVTTRPTIKAAELGADAQTIDPISNMTPAPREKSFDVSLSVELTVRELEGAQRQVIGRAVRPVPADIW
jgi:hypothetical protein